MGRAAGVLVSWSVDTNGHVFRAEGGTGNDPFPHVIEDRNGVEWSVQEVDTPQAWARGKRCLVLNSRDCVRRVWNYPRDWRRLDADTLFALDAPGRNGAPGGDGARETTRGRKT
jgi:hypothetical protein